VVAETVATTARRTMTGVVGNSQAVPMTQRQQHTHLPSAGWKRLRCMQILYLIMCWVVGRSATPSPSPHAICCYMAGV